ncbi:MAG: class II fructose-bisphosphate aldolase family protein [Armatimonadetes bacterium]|nr:class II fructose-bisphosphate aldolase family protein [Armatimonadota bacterium]
MLVTTKELFEKAYGKYALPAFNVNNLEFARAVAEGCTKTQSPFIFQISRGARKYAHPELLKKIIVGIHEVYPDLVFAIHLDHGDVETCEQVLKEKPLFFTSVMIDASHDTYEENIQHTRHIADLAHSVGVSVEAELGMLGGVEEDIAVDEENACLTDPAQAADFVKRSGCDSLAVAIGTSHGAYKFKGPGEPKIHMDRVQEIQRNLPERFPLVMHGSSSVPEEIVEQVNRYGGQIEGSKGVPETLLSQVPQYGVCKVNIDTDLRLAWFAAMRRELAENPGNFDPRPTFTAAIDEVAKLVARKTEVLGSAGHLSDFK